ncbi:transmembrane protein 107 like isoform X8 [Ictalurus furcatus]|uniref:transmembrane protein 107 like isoform X8 n=1 Tax=Ictalurus furcatus TaxID=66913 RepID=UPI0023506BE1|nr:transmembrane protein 107 like isoform X8 [Ictalurus furcatus]
MWAISSLVPARFLTLITHLVIVITIFWSRENSVKACLPLTYTVEEYNIEDVRLVVALSVTLGLFAIELAGFFSGASMFNNNQGLLCILTWDMWTQTMSAKSSPMRNRHAEPPNCRDQISAYEVCIHHCNEGFMHCKCLSLYVLFFAESLFISGMIVALLFFLTYCTNA